MKMNIIFKPMNEIPKTMKEEDFYKGDGIDTCNLNVLEYMDKFDLVYILDCFKNYRNSDIGVVSTIDILHDLQSNGVVTGNITIEDIEITFGDIIQGTSLKDYDTFLNKIYSVDANEYSYIFYMHI